MIKIGIDLDNTIINYDSAFKRVLLKTKKNFDKRLCTKKSIKNFYHKKKLHNTFTVLQGQVYGEFIFEADIYAGFKNFQNYCYEKNIQLHIISHKSKFPILGKKIPLRLQAKKFLKKKKILGDKIKSIKFCDSLENKIQSIDKLRPNIFIDDLEIVLEKIKSKNMKKILFNSKNQKFICFSNWNKIKNFVSKNYF